MVYLNSLNVKNSFDLVLVFKKKKKEKTPESLELLRKGRQEFQGFPAKATTKPLIINTRDREPG